MGAGTGLYYLILEEKKMKYEMPTIGFKVNISDGVTFKNSCIH